MEWPMQKVLQLIELFKNRRCLWDPQDRNYKNSIIKDKAWASIGDQLHCNPIQTKKKMESLLASYRRERKKYKLAMKSYGPSKEFLSRWFAFKTMSFMNDRCFVRRSLHNRNDQEDNSHSQESHDPLAQQSSIEETPPRSTTTFEVLPQLYPTYETKDRTQQDHTNSTNSKTSNIPERLGRDDSDVFGEYVATKHRKYSSHVKNVIEHQIAQILFDADMGTYNPDTTTVTISSRSPQIETQTVEETDPI